MARGVAVALGVVVVALAAAGYLFATRVPPSGPSSAQRAGDSGGSGRSGNGTVDTVSTQPPTTTGVTTLDSVATPPTDTTMAVEPPTEMTPAVAASPPPAPAGSLSPPSPLPVSKSGPRSPPQLGLEECGTKPFVFHDDQPGGATGPMRVRLLSWVRKAAGGDANLAQRLWYRRCGMADEREPKRRLDAAAFTGSGEDVFIDVPYVATSDVMESACVVVRVTDTPALCHAGLTKEQCGKEGGINFVIHHRVNAAAAAAGGSKRQREQKQPHVVVFLLDSMSHRGYGEFMHRTDAALGNASGPFGRERHFSFGDHNALGAQSAVNHGGLFLGAGGFPEKCALFKARREGLPKKRDGAIFAAYEELRRRVFLPDTGGKGYTAMGKNLLGTSPASWLSAGSRPRNSRITTALYPIPQPAWEASCLGLERESDWYNRSRSGAGIDAVWWAFFNEAVSMFNRELGAFQGCIGQRHAVDVMADHVRASAAAAATSGLPATVLLADQTPHQRNWGTRDVGPVALLDTRIAELFADPALTQFWRNSVVVVLGDHGLGIAQTTRSEVRDEQARILHPALQIAVGRDVASLSGEGLASLRAASQVATSHYDVHATLLDIVGLGGGNAATKDAPDGIARSFVSGAGEWSRSGNRSCREMGLFMHSCRYVSSRPAAESEAEALLGVVRELVVGINGRLQSAGLTVAGNSNASICEALTVPEAVSGAALHTLATGDWAYASATFSIPRMANADLRRRAGPATWRVETQLAPVKTPSTRNKSQLSTLRHAVITGVRSATRVTPYAPDEQACGAGFLRAMSHHGKSNGSAAKSASAVDLGGLDLQWCLCAATLSGAPQQGFVGG